MISYKKYINPLKEVKQEQKPHNNNLFLYLLDVLAIIKPKKNEPIIEIMKLLFITYLIEVAKYATIKIKI